MAAPSMVSRDGEHTIVKSVDAVFGASEDDEDEENESGEEEEGEGGGGSQEGGSGTEEPPDTAELPQCKIKRNYTCSLCDYYTQNPRFYLYHQKQVHKEKIKIFECPHCLYASKHSQKLQRHIHMVHIMGKKKLSKKKVKLLKKAAKLRKNMPILPKPPPPPPSSQPESPLDEDDLDAFDESALENLDEDDYEDRPPEPMFGVDGSQVYKCSVCDMLSKSRALIAKHERVVHLKKKFFRCNKCNYMTHMKARYTKHVKYHSMPMIKCDMCDFKTPYKWNLDRHNKNHQGEGAFKCVMCNFAADIKQSLTVHEMNHHVPPVGHLAGYRRRLRVGASDTMGMLTEEDGIDEDELDLLRMEREGSLDQMEQNPADFLQTQLEEPQSPPLTSPQQSPQSSPNGPQPMKLSMRQVLVPVGKMPWGEEKGASPGLIQIHKYKCKICDYTGNLGEVQRHEASVHGGHENISSIPRKVIAKRPIPNLIPIQGQSVLKPPSERKIESDGMSSGSKSNSPTPNDPQESFKRKNASFFDKLKEKLMTNTTDRDLTCGICGYEAKCLSDHLMHQKSHSDEDGLSSNELSSTRCQHCRQRCKTSSDLKLHLQTCTAALNNADQDTESKKDAMDIDAHGSRDGDSRREEKTAHPMENKVFVWNNFSQEHEPSKPQTSFEMNFYKPRCEEEQAIPAARLQPKSPTRTSHNGGSQFEQNRRYSPEKETTRKVFKCPSCSFWASTASRFHVHIVGHLNKRPFQCSLCHYSSNWRWDITKHIRLKQMRDSQHEKARVLLTDEAGRRNYSKYNKYLVPISIEEFRRAQVPRRGNIPKELFEHREGRMPTKRPGEDNSEDSESAPKKKFSENKKTMWKCKKCLFRDSDRSVVLAHVKEHYRSLTEGGKLPAPNLPSAQTQNHKRSHHESEEAPSANEDEAPPSDDESCPDFMCETCPFICDSQEQLEEHAEKHFVSPGSSIKCQFCPFYADNARQLLDHVDLHNPDEADLSKRNVVFDCLLCPYVATSYKQLIYHRKWHGQDLSHKCFKCDYSAHANIILTLHVRLHGRGMSTAEHSSDPSRTFAQDPILLADISGVDSSKFMDIPMVWVSKPFGISKLFKCRFCPHVNMRKNNISEHEKMHALRDKGSQGDKCPHCNYICNNAGVLASHLKVHQAFQGQVCGIVDNNKPDVLQIEEMKKKVADYEAAVKAKKNSDENANDEEKFSSPLIHIDSVKEMVALHFCPICPARFLFLKEIVIHIRFHDLSLPFKCEACSYTARQKQHLMAHMKVHTDDYKERTTKLASLYPIDQDYPKPKVCVVLGEPKESSWNWKNESVWVVADEKPPRPPKHKTIKAFEPIENDTPTEKKPLSCDKCPAEFYKELALSYHKSLHGGPGPHKCKYCDYAVKTYGNLLRHEAIHSKNLQLNLKEDEAPVSGTDLFKLKAEAQKSSPQKVSTPPQQEDPEFGKLIFGSPEFVYPTYVKNGKLRDKRYKCHKCPSAFEKREQYKIHLSLHGSKQRFSCDKCDYSVKYYANYTQHLKKHNLNEQIKKQNFVTPVIEERDEEIPETVVVNRSVKSMKMSVADQQVTMIMQARSTSTNKESEQIKRCPYCPYATNRNNGLVSHLKCHSNDRGAYVCKYCDYNVPQPHFLREHIKVHFSAMKYLKPDAYIKCDKLEIWAEPVDSNHNNEKLLIFKDTGAENKKNRFIPKIEGVKDVRDLDNLKGRVCINLKTGEEEVEMDDDEEQEETEEPVPLENGTDERMEEDESVHEKQTIEEDDEEDDGIPQDESSSESLHSYNSASTSRHSHD